MPVVGVHQRRRHPVSPRWGNFDASLALIGLLLPPLSGRADLSEADGLIGLSARAVGWVMRFPAQGYTLSLQRNRQDGKGHYYMFTNATIGLDVSFYLEPAEKCTTADACRENYWQTRHPSMANGQGVRRFERNGFALIEFQTSRGIILNTRHDDTCRHPAGVATMRGWGLG